MAYTINKSDGSILGTVSDSTVNVTSADIVLIGRNYTEYGEVINENNVWMLENFAGSEAPIRPIEGQCWWNSEIADLTVYDGTSFVSLKGSITLPESPINPSLGDFWWDETNNNLKIYDGVEFSLVGGSTSSIETPVDSTVGDLWWDAAIGVLNVYDGVAFVPVSGSTSSATPPENPSVGNLWWNTSDLMVYDGVAFIPVSGSTSSATIPENPVSGDLWWDETDVELKVYNGTAYIAVGGAGVVIVEPINPDEGDTWWDSDLNQLKVYNGIDWELIGPAGSTTQIIMDNLGEPHNVITTNIDGEIISIWSVDPEFIPNPAIAGYPTIYSGLNLLSSYWIKGPKIELGGDLDTNGLKIVSLIDQDVRIEPNIHVITADNSDSYIKFSDTSAIFHGGHIHYDHAIEALSFTANRQAVDDTVQDLSILSTGALSVGTLNYETLVISDNIIPNKKYVDDAVDGGSSGDLVVNGIVTVNNINGALNASMLVDDAIIFTADAPKISLVDSVNSGSIANVIMSSDTLSVATSTSGNANIGNIQFTTGSGIGTVDTFTVRRNDVDEKIWSDSDNLTWIIKNANFSVIVNNFYMCVCDASYTITLPITPTVGDAVSLKFDNQVEVNNILINRNGKNIIGVAEDLTIDVNNIEVHLIYVDATYGWAF